MMHYAYHRLGKISATKKGKLDLLVPSPGYHTYIMYLNNTIKQKTDLCSSPWDHDVLTFSALLALCEWNPQFTAESPFQRTVLHNAVVFAWASCSTNSRCAWELRLHIPMWCYCDKIYCTQRSMRQIPRPRDYRNPSNQYNQSQVEIPAFALKLI